jgi:hypothetical protein
MTSPVAIPEKTLEHWCSQYITFTYSTRAALWWPATGQDIDFGCLPALPGKAVQLELKTITPASPGVYDVHVDMGQLWEYVHRPKGHQPFYVFPWPRPDWNGSIASVAAAGREPATELGFSRSGYGLWFASWMAVLTAAGVAAVLGQELAAYGSMRRGRRERLVRFDHGSPTWGSMASDPGAVDWLELWPALEHCGRADWPQLIRLPAHLLSDGGPYDPPQVMTLLRRAASAAELEKMPAELLVTLEPDAEGAYRVSEGITDDPAGIDQDDSDQEDRSNEPSDHRLIAFLDAHALSDAP